MIIRQIELGDNPAIAKVIRDVLIELNVPKVGTAYADPYLDYLFETYNVSNAMYFVIEKDGRIIGGAGIMQLENEASSVCELQKMYLLTEGRGLGFGQILIDKCIEKATEFGFESCYLETMPYMENAQKLYKKAGFEYLCEPMGTTGHTSCPVWMLKPLNSRFE